MNAALLKRPSTPEGTSFAWLALFACVAHPNPLSAPSPFHFAWRNDRLKLPSLPARASVVSFRGQKGNLSSPPNPASETQVP
jgi:hypothetical protein